MEQDKTYAVRLVRPGPALPFIEVGVYRYVGDWLPYPGDIITVTKLSGPTGDQSEVRGFVTRVDPLAATPISVTEIKDARPEPTDDYLVEPGVRPAA